MRRSLPEIFPWLVALAASTVVFYVLAGNAELQSTLRWQSPSGHSQIVTLVAGVCAVVSGVICVAALRSPNPRLLWLALAFLTLSGFYAVHGLTTPGIIIGQEYRAVIGFSGRLAFLSASMFLVASAIDWECKFARAAVRWRVALLAATVAGLVAYGATAIIFPAWVPKWFVESPAIALGSTVAVVAFGSLAAARYFVGYWRSGQPLFGAVTVGTLLVVEAQISMHLATIWQGTFWLYHFQLLAGCVTILWGLIAEWGRGRTMVALEQLTASDVMSQLRAGQTESIVSLAAALEGRDGYTLGHGERVAALSILVGQQLKVPAPRLRAIAAGALLHDVGKIGVPDAVLHKRGPLDPSEYDVIKEHTTRGDTMISQAMNGPVERAVVRHHHERWDGNGYPDGLAGEAIPLEARIVAVADVYDALRSNRAYRAAHTREETVAMIEAGRGTQLDPRCVDALLVVAGEWEAQYAADHVAYDERRSA